MSDQARAADAVARVTSYEPGHDVTDKPNVMRLTPEAVAALRDLKETLLAAYKTGRYTAEEATLAYMDAMAQTVRNPAALIRDDNDWTPVKCRRCHCERSVAKDLEHYACRCSPTVKRTAFLDMIDRNGDWIVDPFSLPVNA